MQKTVVFRLIWTLTHLLKIFFCYLCEIYVETKQLKEILVTHLGLDLKKIQKKILVEKKIYRLRIA